MLNSILYFVLLAVCYVRVVVRTTRGLHILQLDGYKPGRYLKWISTHLRSCFEIYEIIAVLAALTIVSIFNNTLPDLVFPLVCVSWISYQVYRIVSRKKVDAKKPLVYTARAKRLFGLALSLLGLLAILFAIVLTDDRWRIAVFLFCELTVPILVISSIMILPIELTINGAYLRDARKRINTLKPKIIGITGSYGKTSTKYILQQILSKKYNTLMTPDSYNTPMGICKVIRGDLAHEHEMFIVEMGAYKQGDIKELCRLAPPTIGILTAVGPQHLERFKSIKNTAKAKYELIEALPPEGLAVINYDNDICAELADNTTSVSVIRYSMEAKHSENELISYKATNITQNDKGLSFSVSDDETGPVEVKTKLLGKHNVSNILAAIAVSRKCGMSFDEIRSALETLEPVPHRLELKPSVTGVTVIDDSFNSNPEGARAALEVLTDFVRENGGKKVLVTPGMVELGDREYDENKRLGIHAAKVCDLVILVGNETTVPILEGLKHENFPEKQICKVKNLSDAQAQLAQNLKPGDVVLFENDLPDNYN